MDDERAAAGGSGPARLALWGAAAFGLGLALQGAAWVSFGGYMAMYALSGAIGGGSLGLAIGGWRRAAAGAAATAAGALVGFFIGFFIVVAVWDPVIMGRGIPGLLGGAGTGAGLGWALGRRPGRGAAVGALALAGALGFFAGFMLWGLVRNPSAQWGPYLAGVASGGLTGIPGGAALGLALGYLRQSQHA